jgi:hypothetical protein
MPILDSAINDIYSKWKISEYPKFLKSCSMHKSAWDLMKLKFVSKILAAHEQLLAVGEAGSDHSPSPTTYVISFLGSSVAAGHDSFFNQSYPVIVGETLKPVFESLGIRLISRNVALGNNPCMPYDICVKIFAGLDADMVQWEQTYNCGDSPILEQFVRQAMMIPTKPLIVFSESSTFNWLPEKCDPPPPSHTVTPHEQELLDTPPVRLVSELNQDEFKRHWNVLHDVSRTYHGAGIQTFTHNSHEGYACLGPYIKEWQKGAVSWHPSVRAHRLRADHHSYFWLLALRETVVELTQALKLPPSTFAQGAATARSEESGKDGSKDGHKDGHKGGSKEGSNESSKDGEKKDEKRDEKREEKGDDSALRTLTLFWNKKTGSGSPTRPATDALTFVKNEVRARLYGHYYSPAQAVRRKRLIHNTSVIDDVQCFSDYEPRSMDNSSLSDRIISGATATPTATGSTNTHTNTNTNDPKSNTHTTTTHTTDTKDNGWKHVIYENLVDEKLIAKSRRMGYKDFKYLLYAEPDAQPLSLHIPVKKTGPVFIW